MSVSILKYLDQVDVQNLNVESNTPSLGNTYSNITQSNDLIEGLGIPNATWVQGVGVSTDPDVPNGLIFSCNLNDPVTPAISALELVPTGSSGIGNSSIAGVPGDCIINGQLTVPALAGTGSFTAVGVDENGLFTTATTQGYVGKTSGSIVTGGDSIFQSITDESWMNYNLANGICNIYFNLSGKVNATSGTNNALFAIQNVSGTVPVPEITADYVQGNPTANFVTMYGYLNNGSFPANSVAGLCYLEQGTSAIIVYMSPTITFSADDDVQFIGNVSYPIASLV
jgi:hypothetical protein